MAIHHLKTWPEFYRTILDGSKTFELRKNDRNFEVGDTVILQEWNPDTETYTGDQDEFVIGYIITSYDTDDAFQTSLDNHLGLTPGYCIMSIFRAH